MKTRTLLRAGLWVGLCFATLTSAARATSFSVRNNSDAEVNFSAFGCGGEAERGPIWSPQAKSLDLDHAFCSGFTLRINIGTWWPYTLDPYLEGVGRFPTGFRRVKDKVVTEGGLVISESVWVAENGSPDQANRLFKGGVELILTGNKDWINAREYDLFTSNKDWDHWDLRNVNLRGANLSKISLRVARLNQSDLTLANLREADLDGAILIETNLSWADLSHADLRGADLRQANLSKATLTGSKTDSTTRCPSGQMGPCW